MAFEDYNYGLYNKYILKDPDANDSEDEETMMKKLQLKKLNQGKSGNLGIEMNQDGEFLPL